MMTDHSGTRPTRTMKLKKMFKPGNEDLFQEREYCIDIKQDNDFMVELCMEEMKENMKFRQVYLCLGFNSFNFEMYILCVSGFTPTY